MRILCIELLESHLVIVSLRVTEFCARLRSLGQSDLHLHDVLHLLFSHTLLKTKELEHADDMLFVSLTDLGGSLVSFQIIVFLSQGQSALRKIQDVVGCILLVSTNIRTKQLRFAIGHHLQLDGKELVFSLCSLHFLDERHDWRQAVLFTTGRIHRQLVEVAQFLFDGTSRIGILLQLLQNTIDALVVVFSQTVKAAVARIGSR